MSEGFRLLIPSICDVFNVPFLVHEQWYEKGICTLLYTSLCFFSHLEKDDEMLV